MQLLSHLQKNNLKPFLALFTGASYCSVTYFYKRPKMNKFQDSKADYLWDHNLKLMGNTDISDTDIQKSSVIQ